MTIYRIISATILIAGNLILAVAQEPCFAEKTARQNAERFPELIEKQVETKTAIDLLASKILQNAAENRSIVSIPVVVHIVHKGNVENISDEQIRSQIEVLNLDFRQKNVNFGNTPSEFKPVAADMGIEFCLASVDPSGKPTNGITRRATTYDNVAQSYLADGTPRICYTAFGGTDAWDSERYLNIWVGKIGGGILGFATFPGTAPKSEDGVFIDPRYFGKTGLASLYPPNHLGRTCVHEIGHFFDLYHIWGGNANTCDDDDGVGDTPVQRSAFDGCPTHPQLSCGNKAMFMNFMDYTNDACMTLFTQGQKARALATLQIARPGLLTSNACSTVSSPEVADNQRVRVFPNPAFDFLNIELENGFGQFERLRFSDALGRDFFPGEVQQVENQLIVDVSGLPPGIFVVQIFNKNGRARISKIMKE